MGREKERERASVREERDNRERENGESETDKETKER